MTRTKHWAAIVTAARLHGLDPQLVEAVVVVESAGYPSAIRPEPAFFSKYQAGKPEWAFALPDPGRYGSSYGLMQVMVAVACEVGFLQMTEPEYLFIPRIGLDIGCRKLAELIAWAKRVGSTMTDEIQLRSALAAYNGGHLKNEPDFAPDRNQEYAEKVLRLYASPR